MIDSSAGADDKLEVREEGEKVEGDGRGIHAEEDANGSSVTAKEVVSRQGRVRVERVE